VAPCAVVTVAPGAAFAQPSNGHEDFTVISAGNFATNGSATIAATGAFNAAGKLIRLTPNSDTPDVQEAIFPGRGKFLVHVSPSGGTDSLNAMTCVDRFTFTDDLTFSDGTGQFAGINGTGTDVGRGTTVSTRTRTECDSDIARGVIVIRGNADLSFPTASAAEPTTAAQRPSCPTPTATDHEPGALAGAPLLFWGGG